MLYAQVGHHHLARTTETSLKRSSGTLSCLSARPPDLANRLAAQPEVACVRPSIVPFVYSKRAAAARSPRSRYRRSNVLSPLRANRPWNYPLGDWSLKPYDLRDGWFVIVHVVLIIFPICCVILAGLSRTCCCLTEHIYLAAPRFRRDSSLDVAHAGCCARAGRCRATAAAN